MSFEGEPAVLFRRVGWEAEEMAGAESNLSAKDAVYVTLLRLYAEAEPEPVPLDKLSKACGKSASTVRNDLTRLKKEERVRFHGDSTFSPITTADDFRLPPSEMAAADSDDTMIF